MVFESKSWQDTSMTFNLTCTERERVEVASFAQKPELLKQIESLSTKENDGSLLRLKNIICVNGRYMKQEEVYFMPMMLDKLASDLMDLSISYAILWTGKGDLLQVNEVVIAKTANDTTNIDADVIEAFLKKFGKMNEHDKGGV